MQRRKFLETSVSAALGVSMPNLSASNDLEIIDYPSPKRRTRPNRISTDHIILHNTEASSISSLNSLTRFGNANYMVDGNGDVYRIMGPDQISTGAGRSMWDGKTNLDNSAINIEFVGNHNREPTSRQLQSGKELIEELRSVRGWIGDRDIMPHSMIAYGAPNRWHERSHRGRKRCGMLFAKENVRDALGLSAAPNYDPDVRSGRLVVADPYLEDVLYGDGQATTSSVEHSDEPEEVISTITPGESPWTYAGREFADSTTTYFLNDGRVRRGDELEREGFDFDSVQPGTRIAAGYVFGGHISPGRTAYQIAGRKWNLPSTIYRLPNGEIKTGDDMSENTIPQRSLILFRR